MEHFHDKFPIPKTREFIEALKLWVIDPNEKSMFLMEDVMDNVKLTSQNIGTLRMLTLHTLNLFDIFNADKATLTPAAVEYLNGRYILDYEEDDEE